MTFIFELEQDRVMLNKQAKYLVQQSFTLSGYTHTHRGPVALPGPLKLSANIITASFLYDTRRVVYNLCLDDSRDSSVVIVRVTSSVRRQSNHVVLASQVTADTRCCCWTY